MPTKIDVYEFTRTGRSAEGCEALGSLGRLSSLLASPAGDLVWRLDGWSERDASGAEQNRLRLRLSATVGMRCGRCLGVVSLPLAVDRGFLLTDTESDAAMLDEIEEELDVLAASRQFSVDDLLEDEAILALPPAASHAECSRPTDMVSPGDSADRVADSTGSRRPSPFAALASLKRKPSA